jgi:hypothetical protein
MTAVVGGAVIPALIGYVADKFGIQHSFFIPPSATSSSPTTASGPAQAQARTVTVP